MSKITDYILNMIPYMIISLPLIFLSRMVIVQVRKLQKTTTFLHETGIHIFFLYYLQQTTIDENRQILYPVYRNNRQYKTQRRSAIWE